MSGEKTPEGQPATEVEQTHYVDSPETKRIRRPRLGLFRGPGGTLSEEIGEMPDEPAGARDWRSQIQAHLCEVKKEAERAMLTAGGRPLEG